MSVDFLTMLVILGNPEKYPDAVLEVAVGGGDMENVLTLCRQHLDEWRETFYANGWGTSAGDIRTFLSHLSDSQKFGRVQELHESGVCTQCTINKQGRLPRWSR